jgi:hypothetical protein
MDEFTSTPPFLSAWPGYYNQAGNERTHRESTKRPDGDEQRGNDEHLREIAEKVRQPARQTDLPEAREELFDLAGRLNWMVEDARTAGG